MIIDSRESQGAPGYLGGRKKNGRIYEDDRNEVGSVEDRTTGVFAVENEYAEEARKYVKAASRGRRL